MYNEEAVILWRRLEYTADQCLNHAAVTGFGGMMILATSVGILPYASMPIGIFTFASGANCLAVAFQQAVTDFVVHHNTAMLNAAPIIQQSILPPRWRLVQKGTLLTGSRVQKKIRRA